MNRFLIGMYGSYGESKFNRDFRPCCLTKVENLNNLTFTTGEVDEAISIMREAAQWLIDSVDVVSSDIVFLIK